MEEGIERQTSQSGGKKKWKNPYFSNMQTGLFIRQRLTHVFEQLETTTWWEKSGGLAKQMSFLDAAEGRMRKGKMMKRMKRYIPENLTHCLTVSWA